MNHRLAIALGMGLIVGLERGWNRCSWSFPLAEPVN